MYDTCRASFQDKFIMSQCGIYDVTSRSILILFPTLYHNEKIFYIIRSGYEKKIRNVIGCNNNGFIFYCQLMCNSDILICIIIIVMSVRKKCDKNARSAFTRVWCVKLFQLHSVGSPVMKGRSIYSL